MNKRMNGNTKLYYSINSNKIFTARLGRCRKIVATTDSMQKNILFFYHPFRKRFIKLRKLTRVFNLWCCFCSSVWPIPQICVKCFFFIVLRYIFIKNAKEQFYSALLSLLYSIMFRRFLIRFTLITKTMRSIDHKSNVIEWNIESLYVIECNI